MDEEKLREKILNELKEQYQLIPKNSKTFTVNDILEKYVEQIIKKIKVPDKYDNRMGIYNALRKVTCLKFGVPTMKDLPVELREKYRIDLENLILEILKVK